MFYCCSSWFSSSHSPPDLVCLSASVSRELFSSACAAFAAQLESDGDLTRAASYLLMANRLQDAVEVLRRGGQFRTALALARARLDPDSPALRDLSLAWARQATADGNMELAARF